MPYYDPNYDPNDAAAIAAQGARGAAAGQTMADQANGLMGMIYRRKQEQQPQQDPMIRNNQAQSQQQPTPRLGGPSFGGGGWKGIASGIAGAARGYEGAKGHPVAPPNPNGIYSPTRPMPSVTDIASSMPPPKQGIPSGMMPPPMPPAPLAPAPQVGPPPMMGGAPSLGEGMDDSGGMDGDGYSEDADPMARGRIVTKPTTALIGEDGPEMVVPLNGRTDARVSPSMLRMNYRGR